MTLLRTLAREKVCLACYTSSFSLTIHISVETVHDPFPKFDYTGSLRPAYPLSPKRHVPEHIQRPDYADDGVRSNSAIGGHTHIICV